jgi:hypothetical protein
MTQTALAGLKQGDTTRAEALTLAELQSAFQRAVMSGDDNILNSILDNSRTNRGVLFGVYRHAYVSRLIDIVRNDHRLLHRYLGDEAFAKTARAYIAARPSRTQNARWFSHGLPDFLAEAEIEHPEVAELAGLERMVNDAFDAADGPVLAISDLAAIPPEEWTGLKFVPHPSARHLDLATNAYAIWAALKDDTPPPPASKLKEVERIVAWRRDVTPLMRRMAGEEAMMWNEADKGVPFGVLCELVATYDDPDGAAMRAAQYLQGWIAAGMLSNAAAGR